MIIKKTKDYDQFKFRTDNRERITPSHVKALIESIKSRNLLELRPISVNGDLEVIDGQHRLLAAKALMVEIYYQMDKQLEAKDILLMNVSKSWIMADYLNFYCKNGNQEYQKLADFLKKYNISLKVALNIMLGGGKVPKLYFKKGSYIFNEEEFNDELDICWDTIGYIKRMNGFSNYTSSSRFWKCLIKLIRHADFNATKWRQNLEKMVERFCPKATTDDYMRLFMDVYNWRNNDKINLLLEEIEEK
jgi:hypothetical protein